MLKKNVSHASASYTILEDNLVEVGHTYIACLSGNNTGRLVTVDKSIYDAVKFSNKIAKLTVSYKANLSLQISTGSSAYNGDIALFDVTENSLLEQFVLENGYESVGKSYYGKLKELEDNVIKVEDNVIKNENNISEAREEITSFKEITGGVIHPLLDVVLEEDKVSNVIKCECVLGRKYIAIMTFNNFFQFRNFKGTTISATSVSESFTKQGNYFVSKITTVYDGLLVIATTAGAIIPSGTRIAIYDITDSNIESVVDRNLFDSDGMSDGGHVYSIEERLFNAERYHIIGSNYDGKHYSAIGDSLTANGSGGAYLDYIDNVLHTTHTNTGMGGTRITGSHSYAMWQDSRMEKLNIDSDFITIMGGTNDVGKNLVVSDSDFTLDNHDSNNFVGAYNLMLSKIYYKFLKRTTGYYSDVDYSGITQVEIPKENFFILIITPPKTLASVDKYNEIILFDQYVTRIADMWGIPVVHAGEQMGMSWMTYAEKATDMVHFGRKWHNRLGQLCVSKLREIEPVD